MYITHARLPIQPEKRDEFIAAASGLVTASNTEEGVLSYELTESVAEPNLFIMVERYKDADAWNAHLASPHFGAAAQGLGAWLSGPPEIIKYEAGEGEVVNLG